MFDSDLGQKQTVAMRRGDEQAVPANLHLARFERKQLGQDGNFDLQAGHFSGAQSGKSRVPQGRAFRAMSNRSAQRFSALDHSDATSKFSVNMNGYEDSAPQRETCRQGFRRFGDRTGKRAQNHRTSQSEHGLPLCAGKFVLRKGRHPRTSREPPSFEAFCAV